MRRNCAQRVLRWVPGAVFALAAAAQLQAGELQQPWRWSRFATQAGLPSATVLDVAEGSDGVLWAATGAGAAWYDDFVWRRVEGLPSGGPGTRVRLEPGWDGEMLLVWAGRLFRLRREGAEQVRLPSGRQGAQVRSAAALGPSQLMVVVDGGLIRLGEGRADPVAPPEGAAGRVHWIQRSRGGGLWVGAYKSLFLLKDGRWRRVLERTVERVHEDARGELALARTRGNELWSWSARRPSPRKVPAQTVTAVAAAVAPSGRMLAAYNDGRLRGMEKGRWRWLKDVPAPLVNPSFLRFQRNGDLWAGSEQGLFLCRLSSARWKYWKNDSPALEVQVNALLAGEGGEVWVGTPGGIVLRHPEGRVEHIREAAGQPLAGVTALGRDAQGGIWAGSGYGFTGAFRCLAGRWTRYGPENGLKAINIHRIAADSRGGLWFLGISPRVGGTRAAPEPGAFRWDGSRFQHRGAPQALPHGRVYDFAEGPEGAFWFATYGGLSRYRDGAWRHWTSADGLRRDRVFTVAASPSGRVYFGHQNFGLGYLDEGKPPRYLTTDDGLIDNRVWDLAFAGDGSLWISTSDGLSRFQDGRFASFGQAQGLHNTRVWPVLPLAGRILAGTGGGVAELSLREASAPAPRVVLSDPLVGAGEGHIFRWAAFSYRGTIPSEWIETRYRLDNQAWSPWSATREASFASLEPGGHRLAVQAKGLFGGVAEAAALRFEVPPPFYRSPLVLALAGIWLFSLAGLALHHHRRLRSREEHFRSLIENAHESITVVQPDGTIEYQSPSIRHLLGRSPESFVGTSIFDWVHREDAEALRQRLAPGAGALSGSRPLRARLRGDQGNWHAFEATVQSLDLERDGAYLVINARDVTEREQAERTLRESEERFRGLFEHALTGDFVADGQGRLIACNPTFVRIFGFDSRQEAEKANLFNLFADSDAREGFLEDLRSQGRLAMRPLSMARRDGTPRQIIANAAARLDGQGRIEEIQGTLLDDSERKEIEAQFLQAQKMESIGALAGGIAHDFNNLISVINGYSDMALTQLDEEDTNFRQFVEQIKKASDRASLLTRQILAFSRRQERNAQVFDLNRRVEEIADLIRRLIGENIEMETRLDPKAGSIEIDPGQLEQVVMNLAVNARDAMPLGGRLSLRTAAAELRGQEAEELGVEPGAYARLTVRDTGTGMDEATREHIFEPFFTTKKLDKGTGLGLSTVYAILRQNGGGVTVSSEPGKGASFQLYFPRAEDVEDASQQEARSGEADSGAVGESANGRPEGAPTVLLVEDDEAVRELSGQILNSGGYRVLEAEDGEAAVRLAGEFQEPIDLLVTDVVMPGMNGYELGQKMTRRSRRVKVLYLSGYTDDVLDQLDLHDPGVNFMQKPFTPEALLKKVDSVLGR